MGKGVGCVGKLRMGIIVVNVHVYLYLGSFFIYSSKKATIVL